ncbi:hypothetical protein ACFIOY_21250 [Bradyrhizobium sp. TZ2]
MAAFGKDAAREVDIGTGDFAGVDTAAERQGIAGVGTKVPDGCKTPPRQHLPHMFFQRRGRSRARVFPYGLREMDVAVPEAGHHGFSGAINNARVAGNQHVAAAADRSDDAVGRDNNRIVKRNGVRRSVDLAAYEGEDLRVCRSAGTNSGLKKEKEKRSAEQTSDHARSPQIHNPVRQYRMSAFAV